MLNTVETLPSDADDNVDSEINECLNPKSPKSFFLYAGAGSGKTFSLVKALNAFKNRYGAELSKRGSKIAVITYTNAACDEIIERIDDDPLFAISTIHSFCWSQISNFHEDIRIQLLEKLPVDIAELEVLEAKGRKGTKASITRLRSIENKKERLAWLAQPREFTYNPNGDNIGKAALSHSEVLQITADFIQSKPTMRHMLANRYPFILIDESQDTNKKLVEAFFFLANDQKKVFGLGLIGDMMQRIYGDGSASLGDNIPDSWAKPRKKLNRRCPRRIIALANNIRATTDKQMQSALEGVEDGTVRFFVAPANIPDKIAFESSVREKMAEVASDDAWLDIKQIKTLTLEHRMASIRMGFDKLFEPLYGNSKLSTGLLDGSLPALRLFSDRVLPLARLMLDDDDYGIMSHLRRQKSPLLLAKNLLDQTHSEDPLLPSRKALSALKELTLHGRDPSFLEILQCVSEYQIFEIPTSLQPFAEKIESIIDNDNSPIVSDDFTDKEENSIGLDAISEFLDTPYLQIHPYVEYMSDEGAFDTHQGVKGREFSRVMVVMDDSEAKGFLFSYEKLFAVKSLTSADKKKVEDGLEIGTDRTKRLLYVTATRAEKSLALVAYTSDPQTLAKNMLGLGWFKENEIIVS